MKIFKHLLDTCKSHGFTLYKSYLHLDFEIAGREAARHLWPDVVLKACQFHSTQAKRKKSKALGLSAAARMQTQIRCRKLAEDTVMNFWCIYLKPEGFE